MNVFQRARENRGVAILMVIVVLAGLAALAAPFVFSMIQHERAARNDLYAVQAGAGAQAAITHGFAHLNRNLMKVKRYDPTPDTDDLSELQVDTFLPASANLDVQDPHGLFWYAKIEDEQGKVNVHAASPALLGNLLGSAILTENAAAGTTVLQVDDASQFSHRVGLGGVQGWVCVGISEALRYTSASGGRIVLIDPLPKARQKGALVYDGRAASILEYPYPGGNGFRPFRSLYEVRSVAGDLRQDEFARIERFITIYSGRNGPEWGHPELNLDTNLNGSSYQINVENISGIGPGSRVRTVQKGKALSYHYIEAAGFSRRGAVQGWVRSLEPLGVSADGSGVGNQIYLEPQLRHPININTAPVEVLQACFKGLCVAGSPTPVNDFQAQMLAQYLVKPPRRTYHSMQEFKDVLDVYFKDAQRQGIEFTAPMRDAVYINASESNSPKLRLSTASFCFRSFGSYTIEGTGVVNAPTGEPLARQTLREVVRIGTPPPGDFKIRSQLEFQQVLDEGMAHRLMSWPVPMPSTDPRFYRIPLKKFPDERVEPGIGEVRLGVGEVGQHGFGKLEWIEHCDNYLDPRYFQEGFDLSKNPAGFKNPGIHANGYMLPGSVEIWVKPRSNTNFFLYDQGTTSSPDRNRVSVQYDKDRGIVIRMWDANLEQKYVEYVYPLTGLNANIWHHLAASWKGGYVGGMEARIDANPVPKNTDTKTFPSCKLGGGIKEDDDTIMGDDLGDPDFDNHYPALGGAIRIGEEIIEYYERTGFTFKKCKRGMRLSTAVQHNPGEYILPYGYAARFNRPIHVGGATLPEPLYSSQRSATRVNKPGGQIMDTDTKIPVTSTVDFPKSGYLDIDGEVIFYKKKTATEFQDLDRGLEGSDPNVHSHNARVELCSILVTNANDYEPNGVVQIEMDGQPTTVEWIGYDGPRQDQYLISHFWSPSPDPKPKHRYINSPWRDSYSTALKNNAGQNLGIDHAANAKVIPVIFLNGPWLGDHQSPQGQDTQDNVSNVSVVSYGQSGDLRFVRRAYLNQWPHFDPITGAFIDWEFEYMAGLNDFTSRQFEVGDSRILRWPSGEMPDSSSSQRAVCDSILGQGAFMGQVDELKVLALNTGDGKVAPCQKNGGSFEGLPAGDNTFVDVETQAAYPVNHGAGGAFVPQWSNKGGVIKIDDELIYYKSAAAATWTYYCDVAPLPLWKQQHPNSQVPTLYALPAPPPVRSYQWELKTVPNNNDETRQVLRLTGLTRGIFGSKEANHQPGCGVMLYDAWPVSALQGGLNATSDTFSLQDARGFPPEGNIWVDNEVVSYRNRKGNTFNGCKAFHGRYGTSMDDHSSNASGGGSVLVRSLPFRYWDRCPSDYEGPGLAFLQCGQAAEDANWDELTILTKAAEPDILPTHCKPYTLVRFDGRPAWEETPSNRPGGMYAFKGAGKFGLGHALASQMEVRVYWQYTSGAFQPQTDWKRTFGLDELRATYSNPQLVRRLDMLEKR